MLEQQIRDALKVAIEKVRGMGPIPRYKLPICFYEGETKVLINPSTPKCVDIVLVLPEAWRDQLRVPYTHVNVPRWDPLAHKNPRISVSDAKDKASPGRIRTYGIYEDGVVRWVSWAEFKHPYRRRKS